jgi:hypothetical protein
MNSAKLDYKALIPGNWAFNYLKYPLCNVLRLFLPCKQDVVICTFPLNVVTLDMMEEL